MKINNGIFRWWKHSTQIAQAKGGAQEHRRVMRCCKMWSDQFNTIIIPYQNDWLFFGTKNIPERSELSTRSFLHGFRCTNPLFSLNHLLLSIYRVGDRILKPQRTNHFRERGCTRLEFRLCWEFCFVSRIFALISHFLVGIQGIVNSIH